jgi:hypothetical protein
LKYLADPMLMPDRNDEHREFILRRRRVAEQYLNHPHLWKEAGVVVGCVIAFICTIVGEWRGSSVWIGMGYAALIVTLVGNEALVASWRVVRRRLLAGIDEDEHLTCGESAVASPAGMPDRRRGMRNASAVREGRNFTGRTPRCESVERVKGIEPSSSAWKAVGNLLKNKGR